jgi:hypothetical protein
VRAWLIRKFMDKRSLSINFTYGYAKHIYKLVYG